jgi:hypothetical protein
MNIKPSFYSMLAGLICLSLTTIAVAQQDRPTEDGPVIIRPGDERLPRRSFTAPQDRDPIPDQVILINSKYAGWETANGALSGSRIGKELRGNWIMVDQNGRFDGTVVAGKNANVERLNVFLMHMGRLVKQTNLDAEGRFEFNNVRQGAYSLIGWGDQGFFAFGLNILAYNPNGASKVQNSLSVTAFQNKTSINTDWIQYYAPGVSYRVFGRYETGEGRDDPAALFGLEGLGSNLPKSIPATSISSHRVSRTEDGRLVGRVHQFNSINGRPVDVRTTKVLLLEGDSVVASTTTDNYGVFEFEEVPDGSYAVVAAGVDGLGLIAITVGQGDAAMNDAGEFAQQETDTIDFTMVSTETIGWLNHYAEEVAYQRALLAPRPPEFEKVWPAPGAPGCDNSRFCNSAGITFKQWQSGCYNPNQDYSPGQGVIVSAMVKGIQRSSARTDLIFDRAFYQNDVGPQFQNVSPYASGAYGYGPYDSSAFGGQ